MTSARGSRLLHEVAVRILVRYLQCAGHRDAAASTDAINGAQCVDLAYSLDGVRRSVTVKADSYAGVDPAKVARRELVFYRPSTGMYGLESLADTFSRQPGWVQRSQADELFYYRLAIAQTEDEVAALMDEPDDVFFSEIAVERDDLRIIPMRPLQEWFAATGERYSPRPVLTEGRSAWYRIVPEADLEAGVAGVQRVGSIFAHVRA